MNLKYCFKQTGLTLGKIRTEVSNVASRPLRTNVSFLLSEQKECTGHSTFV